MSQTLQSVLCITTNKYLVRVLVVLLHARFSVVSPIPFLLAAIFFSVHPYIGSTTVLPDNLIRNMTKLGSIVITAQILPSNSSVGLSNEAVDENAYVELEFLLTESALSMEEIVCCL